jgi:glycerol uptake facilitator protein
MDSKLFLAELIGTCLLVLLGNGVVANVVLAKTKGNGSGWIVIAFGWGMAVFVGVMTVGSYSGAHLNPAVTIAMAAAGKIKATAGVTVASIVASYICAQMLGGFIGAVLVWIFYSDHFKATSDPDAKLASFCTGPAIRNPATSFFCEMVGTFVLLLPLLLTSDPGFALESGAPAIPGAKLGLGAIGALPVGLLILAIGLSLGGTTGYALNPARDLSPRIAHFLLPIRGKRDSDWGYALIPVIAPIVGGLLAVATAKGMAGVTGM